MLVNNSEHLNIQDISLDFSFYTPFYLNLKILDDIGLRSRSDKERYLFELAFMF